MKIKQVQTLSKMLVILAFLSPFLPLKSKDIIWYDGNHAVSYFVQTSTDPVVKIALDMFEGDIKSVTGKKAIKSNKKTANIRIIELDKASVSLKQRLVKQGIKVEEIHRQTDGFLILIVGDQIVIIGTNGRGTAYGVLELSRLAGVNPWVWWGDVVPEKKQQLTIDSSFTTLQGASVEYRGIFINDEDWSLRPWSYGNYEKAEFGKIGIQTYKKIFQLLMRLRANTIWPAMHEGTKAFFNIPGAKAVAREFNKQVQNYEMFL